MTSKVPFFFNLCILWWRCTDVTKRWGQQNTTFSNCYLGSAFDLVLEMPGELPASQVEVLGFSSQLCFWLLLPASIELGRQQVMARIVQYPSPTWESQIKFLASDFETHSSCGHFQNKATDKNSICLLLSFLDSRRNNIFSNYYVGAFVNEIVLSGDAKCVLVVSSAVWLLSF